jgi:hypothetical protein
MSAQKLALEWTENGLPAQPVLPHLAQAPGEMPVARSVNMSEALSDKDYKQRDGSH